MKKLILSMFILLILVITVGCSQEKKMSNTAEPTQVPNNPEINNTPTTTSNSEEAKLEVLESNKIRGIYALQITGKEWFPVINLTDFEVEISDKPNQFLTGAKINEDKKEIVIITAFAEKIPNIASASACREYYSSGLNKSKDYVKNELGGNIQLDTTRDTSEKLINELRYDVKGMSNIDMHYFDYYDEYCFDFHLSGDSSDTSYSQMNSVIESIGLITKQ